MFLTRRVSTGFMALLLLVGSSVTYAASDPIQLLQGVSNQMLSSLKKNQTTIHNNPRAVYKLVRQILLPHVDTRTMARSVVVRSAWKKASVAQRDQFTREFSTLVVRTYSAAMAAFKNETVRFLPVRGGVDNKKRIQVDSIIVRKSAPSIPVSYLMVLSGNQWKAYDVIVEGISLVQTYRAQFSNIIAEGGISRAIRTTQKHNANKMSQATITLNDANELAIRGHLLLENVETLIQEGRALIHDSVAV